MLGERIRESRKAKGLTMKELGEKLNLAESTVAGYEAGYRQPSPKVLEKIAEKLETSVDYLLGRVDQPFKRFADDELWANVNKGLAVDVNKEKPNSRDTKDLKKVLEQSEVMFDGVPITEEDKELVQEFLSRMFWKAKEMNKRKKKTDPKE